MSMSGILSLRQARRLFANWIAIKDLFGLRRPGAKSLQMPIVLILQNMEEGEEIYDIHS